MVNGPAILPTAVDIETAIEWNRNEPAVCCNNVPCPDYGKEVAMTYPILVVLYY